MTERVFFDLGNTRIKWHLEGSSIQGGALGYADVDGIRAVLAKVDCCSCDVVIASVVRDGREAVFTRQLLDAGVQRISECRVTSSACGVTCGYKDVSRLGIDRWLAVVAGWTRVSRPFVVADLGTAITIDFVGKNGSHEGGFIVPGLQLGLSALLQGTSNVAVDSRDIDLESVHPGINTTDAVIHGAVFVIKASLETALGQFQKEYPEARLLVTGGDAGRASKVLGCPHEAVTDLVFQGMRLLADANQVFGISKG